MSKPIVLFSHANGFPAPCYRQVIEGLQAHGYDVRFIERLGHNPRFPVGDNWDNLVNELLDYVKDLPKPIIGVGHSLGGVLTLYAAIARPDWFSSVVLLDVPLLGVVKESLFSFLKKFDLHRYLMPGRGTLRRKRIFESKEQAMLHFHQKALFRKFDDRCLYDYVSYGLISSSKGLELWFKPEIEEKIYSTIPHNFSRVTKFNAVPGCFIYGKKSDVVGKLDLMRFRKTGFKAYEIPGTHLFPFEYPEETVNAIVDGILKHRGEAT